MNRVQTFMRDNRALIRRVKKLRRHLKLDAGNQLDGVLGVLAPFEHTIHELCHAESMGIKPNNHRSLSWVIADHISNLEEWPTSHTARLREETKALAIEWNVWGMLGFPGTRKDMDEIATTQKIPLGDVLRLANLSWVKSKARCVVEYMS